MTRIDLGLIGGGVRPRWPLGDTLSAPATPRALAELFAELARGASDAVLLWDASIGAPDPAVIEALLAGNADVYHAGLLLGQAGRPRSLRFIEPLWMHACDAPAEIESTSFRASFRACLIRREVIAQMRGPCPEFHSIDAAALELGMHWLRRGVFVRHAPLLVGGRDRSSPDLDLHDELLFARRSFAPSWVAWAAARGALTGAWSPLEAARHVASSRGGTTPPRETFQRPAMPVRRGGSERVTILVPTIGRYPYLRVLLRQLRAQTVPAHEIIVVDQTPAAERDAALPAEFADLPLRWITRDTAGQCSSRNAGLLAATGDYVLLLDDDVEVGPDLVEMHLAVLARFRCDTSSGVVHEHGQPAPGATELVRASDMFPAGNTMVRREVLRRTGLFDLSYDRGQRADADLGMRAYLSGAFMVLEPAIDLLHHHAPRGGLRTHGARVVTYASSRSSLTARHLPSASELYLARRYFGEQGSRELMWQRALGTLRTHGRRARVTKAALGALSLADTVLEMSKADRAARALLASRAAIPALAEWPDHLNTRPPGASNPDTRNPS